MKLLAQEEILVINGHLISAQISCLDRRQTNIILQLQRSLGIPAERVKVHYKVIFDGEY